MAALANEPTRRRNTRAAFVHVTTKVFDKAWPKGNVGVVV